MSDDPRLPYTVNGYFRKNLRVYRCSTPQWALRKLADFHKADYSGITITGPSGPLTEAGLHRIITCETSESGGAPVDVGALAAPALAA